MRLPENKHLIIDAKVSLVAYERVINAETEMNETLALKEPCDFSKKSCENVE